MTEPNIEGRDRFVREQHRTLTPNLIRWEPEPSAKGRAVQACKRFLNGVLGLTKVRLTHTGFPVNDDFNAFSVGEDAQGLWFEKVSAALASYCGTIGLNADRQAVREHVEEYIRVAPSFRLKQLGGGMGFLNGLKLFVFTRVFQPTLIIESGVWRGFTTEIFHHATDAECRILSFDINLDKVEFRSEKQELFEGNWMQFVSEQRLDPSGCLAFFDDHVNQVRRVQEAHSLGLRNLIFDDDYDVSEIFIDKWPAVPTVTMCLNPWCHEHSEIEWRRDGGSFKATWSCQELADVGRLIDLHALFPSLHEEAGFQPGSKMSFVRLGASAGPGDSA